MEAVDYIIKTGFLLVLVSAAIIDLRKRCLSINFLCIALACGFLLQTISGKLPLWQMLSGVATGGLFAVISLLSHEALGYADSFLIAVSGAWLGFYENIFLLLCSFLILAVFGIAALALRKVKIKDSLPFAPFLLAGYMAVLAF